ncbi:hypothetical protein TPA0909_05960 [Streptomyces albus]|nr:hypothetical protein TPA0909_05960 [Streptomyces albus]
MPVWSTSSVQHRARRSGIPAAGWRHFGLGSGGNRSISGHSHPSCPRPRLSLPGDHADEAEVRALTCSTTSVKLLRRGQAGPSSPSTGDEQAWNNARAVTGRATGRTPSPFPG